MVNLLLGACELCGAARLVRCLADCPGEARPREGDPNAIAEQLREYPRPVRPYSPALQALIRGSR